MPEFKHMVDNGVFDVVVDEAHLILQLKSGYDIIRNLDAVFLSGTLEPFFRRDLQRYKFKPKNPMTIYYTEGVVPDFKNGFYFADRAKILMRNYPKQCIVGTEHKFKNFNIHQHQHGQVFSTQATREGISINTKTFEACVVIDKYCNNWSTKDKIQAVNRPRGEVKRIITSIPSEEYTSKINFDWWLAKAHELTSTQEINTIMGEEYSNFIKNTHKQSQYLGATEFGVECYLAEKTRNNYDKDLYEFKPLEWTGAEFKLKTDVDGEEEEVTLEEHTINDIIYQYPSNKREPFMRWAKHKESGLVDRIMNMSEFINFHKLYEKSNLSKDIKLKYNQMFNRGKTPRKYTVKKFYKLLNEVVQLQKFHEGKSIKRFSAKMDIKQLRVKVISECPIDGVRIKNTQNLSHLNDNLDSLLPYKDKALNFALNALNIGVCSNSVCPDNLGGKNEPKIVPNLKPKTDKKTVKFLTDIELRDTLREKYQDETLQVLESSGKTAKILLDGVERNVWY